MASANFDSTAKRPERLGGESKQVEALAQGSRSASFRRKFAA
jgi:hypothetical protein